MPTIDLLNTTVNKGIARTSYSGDKCHSHFPFFFNRGMGTSHKECVMNKEQKRISNHNNLLAWKHFYPEGDGKYKEGYVLHHVDETLRENNLERYIQWNVEDLVMITKSEHNKIHHIGKHRPEGTGRKISEAKKGHTVSDETRQKISKAKAGKHTKPCSEETRQKISEARKGCVFTEEHKLKLRYSHLGKSHPSRPCSDETRRKISETLKGRSLSEETRRKMSEAHKRRQTNE